MSYTFNMTEFESESYTFSHRGLVVSVHLHPIYSSPPLFEQYKQCDPFLAWIFVREPGKPAVRITLNAQYDAMLAAPFFLNRDYGPMGVSLPGTERPALWTQEELTGVIEQYLDSALPLEERLARARQFITELLRGELFVPGPDSPLLQEALVEDDIVYLNARGLALADPQWLTEKLAAPSPHAELQELVRQCMTPDYVPLADLFYLERRPFQWWSIRERIFINPQADQANAIVEFLTTTVLDDGHRFPGVELIRICGPKTVGSRVDGLIVFTCGGDATQRVLDVLREYQIKHRARFRQHCVPLSNPVLPGVSIGEEPGGPLAGIEGFVGLRMRLTAEALREVTERGDSQTEFKELVLARFRASGIDPELPHRNLAGVAPADAHAAPAPESPAPKNAGRASADVRTATAAKRIRRWWWPFS